MGTACPVRPCVKNSEAAGAMASSFCWGAEAARDPATGLVTEQGAGGEPTGLRTQVLFRGV